MRDIFELRATSMINYLMLIYVINAHPFVNAAVVVFVVVSERCNFNEKPFLFHFASLSLYFSVCVYACLLLNMLKK